ncbi:MAG: alpha-mannosidase, partial [Clostridiales bacterium]|nr:alpha-mannosidase [Clostridiales bacterium]
RDLEYMSVLSGSYDKERIDWLYKELLRNQFHDILPGSALTEANIQAREEVTAVIDEAGSTAKKAAGLLTDDSDSVTVFNTTGFGRSDVILDGKVSIDGAASQTYTDVAGRELTAVSGVSIPAFGAVSLKKGAPVEAKSPFTRCGDTLDTPYYTVKFAENGAIASLVDKKTCREIRAEGGNELGTFWFGEDVPAYWDDWNIDSDTLRLKMKPDMRLVSSEVAADGAAEYRVRSEYKVGQYSSVKMDTVFYSASPRVDFQALVDWKDKHSLLKVGFDLNVMAPSVKNEIQFGYVERPTTRNNSLEAAKFEVVNHKYSDVSESRYGVALLNDCKYGISQEAIDGGVSLKLTLHKAGTRPDVTGDEGLHEMTWALLPHEGAFSAPAVLSEAYLLNDPAIAVCGALKSGYEPLLSLSADNIIVEAVKPAEYGKKAYAVRLYEAERNRTVCAAAFKGAARVYETNMLEEIKKELEIKDGKICLEFRPFEIKTILVEY